MAPLSLTKWKNMQEKAEEINLVLLRPDVDLWKLRELALSEGGLVNGTYCYIVTGRFGSLDNPWV
jgi:hypothetical protein